MVSVLAFTWRVGTNYAPPPELISPLGRIGITMLFALGLFYLVLVLVSLRTYGRTMDRKWQERVEKWTKKHRKNFEFSSTLDHVLSIPSSGPFNNRSSQMRNSNSFPPACTYTPVYIPYRQLPSWHEHQYPLDMSHMAAPRFSENHQFCLQTPTDSDPARSVSRRSSPAFDSRHLSLPNVTEQTPRWSRSFTPSIDTTYHSMNSSTEGIVPLRRSTPAPSPLKCVTVASGAPSEDVAQPDPIRSSISIEIFVPPSPQISEHRAPISKS